MLLHVKPIYTKYHANKTNKKTFVSIIRFVMLQLLLISFSIGLVTADDTKTKKELNLKKLRNTSSHLI